MRALLEILEWTLTVYVPSLLLVGFFTYFFTKTKSRYFLFAKHVSHLLVVLLLMTKVFVAFPRYANYIPDGSLISIAIVVSSIVLSLFIFSVTAKITDVLAQTYEAEG